MANFDKTTVDGQQFMEICGKLFPCRTMQPNETLRDPDAFMKAMKKVKDDYRNKSARSVVALSKRIIPGTVNRY